MEQAPHRLLHDPASGQRQGGALIPCILVAVMAAWLATAVVAQAPPAAEETSPIPQPNLDALERVVREQLREEQVAVAELRDRPDVSDPELAEGWGGLGKHYHAYELREAAEACYLKASALAPEDFRWLHYLGLLYQESGRMDEATAYYQRALAIRPNDLATMVHLGEVLLADNRPEQAAARLRLALQVSPNCAAAWAALGQIAFQRGQHQEAVDYLTTALELVPAANRLHYQLAMAYRGMGEMDRAREHLAQSGMVGVTVDDPLATELKMLTEGERIHLLRGRQAFAAERFAEAAEEFRKAVAADPRSARARVNLGTALGQMGDPEGAMSEYRAALEIDPQNGAAHYNLGALLVRAGQAEDGIRHLRRALEIDSEDRDAHLELAAVWRRQGRQDDALRHYREAVRIDPGSEPGRLGEAAVLVDLGRYGEAGERLEAARLELPREGRIAAALARFLAFCPDESRRDLERALDLALVVYAGRSSVDHAVLVARILAALDRCDEAAQWLGGALRAAEEAGQQELVRGLIPELARYESERPCR